MDFSNFVTAIAFAAEPAQVWSDASERTISADRTYAACAAAFLPESVEVWSYNYLANRRDI